MYFRHFLSSPLAVKQNISVTIFSKCMYVRACACVRPFVRPSGFIRAITPTFMHGFQNYLTQFLNLRRKSAI